MLHDCKEETIKIKKNKKKARRRKPSVSAREKARQAAIITDVATSSTLRTNQETFSLFLLFPSSPIFQDSASQIIISQTQQNQEEKECFPKPPCAPTSNLGPLTGRLQNVLDETDQDKGQRAGSDAVDAGSAGVRRRAAGRRARGIRRDAGASGLRCAHGARARRVGRGNLLGLRGSGNLIGGRGSGRTAAARADGGGDGHDIVVALVGLLRGLSGGRGSAGRLLGRLGALRARRDGDTKVLSAVLGGHALSRKQSVNDKSFLRCGQRLGGRTLGQQWPFPRHQESLGQGSKWEVGQ